MRAEAAAKGLFARTWAWLHTTPGLITLTIATIILTCWACDGGLIAYVGF